LQRSLRPGEILEHRGHTSITDRTKGKTGGVDIFGHRAGVLLAPGQTEHDARAGFRVRRGVVVVVQGDTEMIREGGQAVVGHTQVRGAGSSQRARECDVRDLLARGERGVPQGGGIKIRVVRDDREVSDETREALEQLADGRLIRHRVRRDAVAIDVELVEFVDAFRRTAQPRRALDDLAVDDPHQTHLADRAPILVRGLHIEGHEVEARNAVGADFLARTRSLDDGAQFLRALVVARGETDDGLVVAVSDDGTCGVPVIAGEHAYRRHLRQREHHRFR